MNDDRRLDPTSRLLGDFVQQVSDGVTPPPFTAGRTATRGGRRRRRDGHHGRVLAVVGSIVLVVAAVALLIAYGPRSATTGHGVIGRPGQSTHPRRVRVRSISFGGAFHPDEIVGANGALWVTGSRSTDPSTGPCAVERLEPDRLAAVSYALSACGMNVVAGGGHLYLETAAPQRDNSNPIRIESFSTADDTSVVLAPVAMTVFGSEIAHTQLAFADGWLWLYGYPDQPEVVQVSPATGAVVHTFTAGVPAIGGTEPLIAAGPGGVWLAGGPGATSALARLWMPPTGLEWVLAPVAEASRPSGPSGVRTTVEWLRAVGGRLWAGEATAVRSPSDPAGSLAERIVVLSGTGAVVRGSPLEAYGRAPETVGKDIFTAGPGGSCASQPIWRIDPSSLRTSVAVTLHPGLDPCLAEGNRSVTSTGRALFVLDSTGGAGPAVAYRIER